MIAVGQRTDGFQLRLADFDDRNGELPEGLVVPSPQTLGPVPPILTSALTLANSSCLCRSCITSCSLAVAQEGSEEATRDKLCTPSVRWPMLAYVNAAKGRVFYV